MTADPAPFAHAVRADLPRGPAFQPCPCADTAAALFDRLRLAFPGLGLQRLQHGRVVEVANTLPSPAPLAAGEGLSSPARRTSWTH